MLLLQYISGSDTNFLLNFHQLALVSSCNPWSILLSTDCISQRTHLQKWSWTVFSATLIRNITAGTKNCLLKSFIKCYSNLMLKWQKYHCQVSKMGLKNEWSTFGPFIYCRFKKNNSASSIDPYLVGKPLSMNNQLLFWTPFLSVLSISFKM